MKNPERIAQQSIRAMLKMVEESMKMPEGIKSRANASGQIRRRARFTRAALGLLSISARLEKLDYRLVEEQVRKQSRAIRQLTHHEERDATP